MISPTPTMRHTRINTLEKMLLELKDTIMTPNPTSARCRRKLFAS